MSPEQKVEAYLRHMRDAAIEIDEFTADGKDAFLESRLIQAAVVRNLEVIGEAAKHVPEAVRDSHPEIPWQAMAGMRDMLIHAYHRVDIELVWRTVDEALPGVRERLEAFLHSNESG